MAAEEPAPQSPGDVPASTDETGTDDASTEQGERPEDKPTLVLLVRHGKTPTTGSVLPGRAPGLSLADEGRDQARAAAERVVGLERVRAVYASPLERAQETAAPIADALGVGVRTEEGLLECEFGEWTGCELKALFKLPDWREVQSSPSTFRFPEGESFSEMQVRITGAISRIVADHPGEAVVAVSHADPIKAAVAAAIGTHLDLFQRIVISPCSISAIQYPRHGAPVVLAVNSTGTDLRSLVPS
ncbi:MAG: MSMEG_4193 family putative phosphomutase [Acidimicrobiia bacterium]|nr:MSMEG_4193 family putative phosphomutase [Acidimicrobiia bacterium]